tara:strand:+ start:1001 stop:1141 length:141 start_codon:yes stop_codon:yes gene_type:complete
MNLYKKSELAKNAFLIILILLVVLIVVGVMIWQSKGVMMSYLSKIF